MSVDFEALKTHFPEKSTLGCLAWVEPWGESNDQNQTGYD
jgi:hypothetical protein